MDRFGIGAWRLVFYDGCHHGGFMVSSRPALLPSAFRLQFVGLRLCSLATFAGLAVRRSAVHFARRDLFTGGLHSKSAPMPGAHKKAG